MKYTRRIFVEGKLVSHRPKDRFSRYNNVLIKRARYNLYMYDISSTFHVRNAYAFFRTWVTDNLTIICDTRETLYRMRYRIEASSVCPVLRNVARHESSNAVAPGWWKDGRGWKGEGVLSEESKKPLLFGRKVACGFCAAATRGCIWSCYLSPNPYCLASGHPAYMLSRVQLHLWPRNLSFLLPSSIVHPVPQCQPKRKMLIALRRGPWIIQAPALRIVTLGRENL